MLARAGGLGQIASPRILPNGGGWGTPPHEPALPFWIPKLSPCPSGYSFLELLCSSSLFWRLWAFIPVVLSIRNTRPLTCFLVSSSSLPRTPFQHRSCRTALTLLAHCLPLLCAKVSPLARIGSMTIPTASSSVCLICRYVCGGHTSGA